MPVIAYRLIADSVLLLHVAFCAFVVLGLALILVGGIRRWPWVTNPCFRVLHLIAIAFVVAEAWVGVACPLTRLETALRIRAGDATYAGDFIAHWLAALLYYQASPLTFIVGYTSFGLIVMASWFAVRPRPLRFDQPLCPPPTSSLRDDRRVIGETA